MCTCCALLSDELRAYFEAYGEVTDCHIPKNPVTQENKGFGFISYSSSDAVDKLMQEEHHEIKGRTVRTSSLWRYTSLLTDIRAVFSS